MRQPRRLAADTAKMRGKGGLRARWPQLSLRTRSLSVQLNGQALMPHIQCNAVLEELVAAHHNRHRQVPGQEQMYQRQKPLDRHRQQSMQTVISSSATDRKSAELYGAQSLSCRTTRHNKERYARGPIVSSDRPRPPYPCSAQRPAARPDSAASAAGPADRNCRSGRYPIRPKCAADRIEARFEGTIRQGLNSLLRPASSAIPMLKRIAPQPRQIAQHQPQVPPIVTAAPVAIQFARSAQPIELKPGLKERYARGSIVSSDRPRPPYPCSAQRPAAPPDSAASAAGPADRNRRSGRYPIRPKCAADRIEARFEGTIRQGLNSLLRPASSAIPVLSAAPRSPAR